MSWVDALTDAAREEAKKQAEALLEAGKQGGEAVSKAASDAVETVDDEAQNASQQIADEARAASDAVAAETRRALDGIADSARRARDVIASETRNALEKIAGTPARSDLALAGPPVAVEPYRERLLTDEEKDLARLVFEKTLPYGAIWLSTGLGSDQRPYAVPHLLYAFSYVIHIGPDVFQDATDKTKQVVDTPGDQVFIHELTHVWQGRHRHPLFDYVLESLFIQTRDGPGAYDYDESKLGDFKWSEYNVEQQGKIVEHWYANGMRETDPRFRFIRDNIREGAPYD